MKRLSSLTALTLLSVVALASCNSAPPRISFGSSSGGSGNAEGEDPSEVKDIDQLSPEMKNNPNTAEARKSTLDTIMLAAGDKADDSCKPESLKGRSSLRLLTKDEYQNTVKSVLKITADYRDQLPREAVIEGFRNNLDYGKVSDAHAEAYLEAAINIADEVNPSINTLASCASVDEACAARFIDTIGPKLWRRPLESTEKDKLKATYKVGAASSVRHGMTMMISRMLMSPNFLYRSEVGKDGALTAYELSSALSYFFWGTSPDDALISLAANGKILEEATLLTQAERLLKDARSRFATREFARAWLDSQAVKGAIKDAALFPNFTQPVREAMASEAEDTLDYMVHASASSFEDLFKSDFSIGSSTLAKYYGATNEGDKIDFGGSTRKGVLGYGAVLSLLSSPKETHPIRRGHFVLGKIFCQYPEPTPSGLSVQVPEYDPNLPTRVRFAKHTESPSCSNCHKPIDGIGLGMEDFDGAGLFREKQAGKDVDASGSIVNIDGKTSSFNGLGSLGEYVAKSKQAKRCFAVEWYRLAHGHMERPADVCAMRDVANAFEKGSMSLGELLIKIVTHPTYRKKGE